MKSISHHFNSWNICVTDSYNIHVIDRLDHCDIVWLAREHVGSENIFFHVRVKILEEVNGNDQRNYNPRQ